jgi:tetratricopeptide (TPR) repeat protein
VALGLVAYWLHWDWELAAGELERALELSPGHALAHTAYGALLDALGRHEESMRIRRRGLQLNPLDAEAVFNLGYGHLIGREYREAIAQFQRALELTPRSAAATYGLGIAQVDSGDAIGACRTTWMVWFHITPSFDPVRHDLRFQDLIARMRLSTVPSSEAQTRLT